MLVNWKEKEIHAIRKKICYTVPWMSISYAFIINKLCFQYDFSLGRKYFSLEYNYFYSFWICVKIWPSQVYEHEDNWYVLVNLAKSFFLLVACECSCVCAWPHLSGESRNSRVSRTIWVHKQEVMNLIL